MSLSGERGPTAIRPSVQQSPIRPPIPASAEGKHIIGKLGILNLDARDTL